MSIHIIDFTVPGEPKTARPRAYLMTTRRTRAMSTNIKRHSIIDTAIEAAILTVAVAVVSLGGLWVLRVGLDRDNAYEDAKEAAYWEMRSGAPEDRYGN